MAASFVDYPNWMGFSLDGLSLSGAPEPGASPTNKIKRKDEKETWLLYIYLPVWRLFVTNLQHMCSTTTQIKMMKMPEYDGNTAFIADNTHAV